LREDEEGKRRKRRRRRRRDLGAVHKPHSNISPPVAVFVFF
jgi:hypothetical protein